MPTFTRPIARLAIAAGLALAALQGACSYTEGGPGMSIDQFTYVSRSWQPWTITLVDSRTGQNFWSMDVPVGKKLVLQFSENTGTKDGYTPDTMKWLLMEENSDTAYVSNSIPVPPSGARILEPTLRPVPELPESMIAVTRGAVQPVKRPEAGGATSTK